MRKRDLMGPPALGPLLQLTAPGMFVHLRLNDADDQEIARLAMEMAERRRYGRQVLRRQAEAQPHSVEDDV